MLFKVKRRGTFGEIVVRMMTFGVMSKMVVACGATLSLRSRRWVKVVWGRRRPSRRRGTRCRRMMWRWMIGISEEEERPYLTLFPIL